MNPLLAVFVFIIAFLYASVGFGGASGYLAVMSLFNIQASLAASTALLLNMFVSGIALFHFSRSGHLNLRLLWPFIITSIPAAFLGGNFQLSQLAYQILLNLILLYLAVRMLLWSPRGQKDRVMQVPSIPLAMLAGAVLGLVSGMIGIGGGIFLSPLIQLTGWGDSKQAAASSAGFILLNSFSGLTGRYVGGTLEIGTLGLVLIPLGMAGGLLGSYLGARRFSNRLLQRLLGIILLVTVIRFGLRLLGVDGF